MLRFPWWKIIIIIVPCLWGAYSVTPHFFYSEVEKYNDVQAQMLLDQPVDNQALLIAENSWYPWAPSRIVNLALEFRRGAHVLV